MAGLREQKKAQTRSAIAEAAAALFGRDGYPNVAMARVAAAARVSDQTLYNYFPTKESLVFDRSDLFEQTLVEELIGRPAGVDLIEAYRRWLDAVILGDAGRLALANPGGMPRLVATNDGLRRMLLDLAHGVATRLAIRLRDDESLPEAVALAVADAMLAIMVRATLQLGSGAARPDGEAGSDEAVLADVRARVDAAVEAMRPLLGRSSAHRQQPYPQAGGGE